jgi:hypothetical protein
MQEARQGDFASPVLLFEPLYGHLLTRRRAGGPPLPEPPANNDRWGRLSAQTPKLQYRRLAALALGKLPASRVPEQLSSLSGDYAIAVFFFF